MISSGLIKKALNAYCIFCIYFLYFGIGIHFYFKFLKPIHVFLIIPHRYKEVD